MEKDEKTCFTADTNDFDQQLFAGRNTQQTVLKVGNNWYFLIQSKKN